jgi:acetyl-CoA carboxylase carboxyltransferase component
MFQIKTSSIRSFVPAENDWTAPLQINFQPVKLVSQFMGFVCPIDSEIDLQFRDLLSRIVENSEIRVVEQQHAANWF